MWCILGNPLQEEETGEIYDVERIPLVALRWQLMSCNVHLLGMS